MKVDGAKLQGARDEARRLVGRRRAVSGVPIGRYHRGYAMPIEPGRVFLEETYLVARRFLAEAACGALSLGLEFLFLLS